MNAAQPKASQAPVTQPRVSRRTCLISMGMNIGCAWPSVAGAADRFSTLHRELEALVGDRPGAWGQLCTLAVRDGQVVYRSHHGRRTIHPQDRALDRPVTPRTLFRVASISKLVVSVAVMRLVDQGRLHIDADVGDVLGWRLRHPDFEHLPISLRMLMSHRSGLSDAGGYVWGPQMALREVLHPAGSLYRGGLSWRRHRAPGSWFQYVNLNWGVVGTVMERATGERFDQLLHRLVLQPLGLRGGFVPWALSDDVLQDVATLYRRRRMDGEREVWDPEGPWWPQVDDYHAGRPPEPPGLDHYVTGTNATVFSPQGGLRISSDDLGVLMQMLLNRGRHEGQVLLTENAMQLLSAEQWRYTPQAPNGDTLGEAVWSWALGPQRFTDHSGPGRGDRLVEGGGFNGWGHLGDAYGLVGTFALDPVRRHGLIVLLGSPSRSPYGPKLNWTSMVPDQARVLSALWQQQLS